MSVLSFTHSMWLMNILEHHLCLLTVGGNHIREDFYHDPAEKQLLEGKDDFLHKKESHI